MLNKLWKTSIGFKFISSMPLLLIRGIGWQSVKDHKYIWNGKKRKGEYCLLQYTLSGKGEIDVNGKKYILVEGDAFIVEIPGEHCYRLPKSSNGWEFIYIEFSKEALIFFHKIQSLTDRVFSINIDSSFIRRFWEIYEFAIKDEVKNVYQCSNYAYSLIMELISFFYDEKNEKILDSKIEQCKRYIDSNYKRPIGLDDISLEVNLSKYYLIREFQKQMKLTPGAYLTKVRIEEATKLLVFSENMEIEEIAKAVGFSCGNYFSKVFRKNIGVSPTIFRKNNNNYEVNRILFDNDYK